MSKELAALMESIRATVEAMNVRLRDMRGLVLKEHESRQGEGTAARPFETFGAAVRDVLSADETLILGMGFIADSHWRNDDRIQWWYRSPEPGGTLQPLTVGTDPQAFDYYDVAAADWWTAAAASDQPCTSGPYVDLSGTNAYVVTFSLGVRTSDQLLGVVAVDMPVGELQARWQDVLLDLPKPTSLIDSQGAVIATNAGRLLGAVIGPAEIADVSRHPVPQTSWVVIQGSSDG
jgi:hypothetical protein